MHQASDAKLYQFTLPSGYDEDVLVRVHAINGNYLVKLFTKKDEKLMEESHNFITFHQDKASTPTEYLVFVVPDPNYFEE
jgi:hypothetical protein